MSAGHLPAESITIWLLSEDRSEQALPAIKNVVSQALDCSGIKPVGKVYYNSFPEEVRKVAAGLQWRAKANPGIEPKIQLMAREIATKLCMPRSFVVFHFDGDCTWQSACRNGKKWKREDKGIGGLLCIEVDERLVNYGGVCEIDVRFGRNLGGKISLGVRQSVQKRGGDKDSKSEDEEVAGHLARLVRMTPYYSIESWLYQNDEAALAICSVKRWVDETKHFEEWGNDRELLDEVEKPVEVVPRIGRRFNRRLSQKIPAEEMCHVGKSFYAFCLTLANSGIGDL